MIPNFETKLCFFFQIVEGKDCKMYPGYIFRLPRSNSRRVSSGENHCLRGWLGYPLQIGKPFCPNGKLLHNITFSPFDHNS